MENPPSLNWNQLCVKFGVAGNIYSILFVLCVYFK